jgi:hypothetical protein
MPSAARDPDDWRVQAELEVPDRHERLRELVSRLRGADAPVLQEVEAAVPHDVVITHDGSLLFAYAADEATSSAARRAIEAVLAREGIAARIRVSRWDEELDAWQQTDPPPSAQERAAAQEARREAEAVQTRTLVASSGRLVRSECERAMRSAAEELGVQLEIVEHPHLLSTQLAFEVTGPRRKLDEFARDLRAYEWRTIRTEAAVMASPL